ncbi:MAG: RNA polymerase sigma factor [Chloroflexia bacterium]
MDEGEAIARLKQGDIGGLEALVGRYQVRALRTAYLIVRDAATAEDIVQSAFLRVYQRVALFDPARPFGPWFLRIVANDALKAASRWDRLTPFDPSADDGIMQPVGSGPNLDELMEGAETQAAIWAALGELSVEHRTALVLRYYLDLSEAEMASRLDCPPGTVKSRLHHARRRMRHLLPTWLAERNT